MYKTQKSKRAAIMSVFPEAEIEFLYGMAQIRNWRTLEGGRFNARYSGKHDFYAKLREHSLVDFVTIG